MHYLSWRILFYADYIDKINQKKKGGEQEEENEGKSSLSQGTVQKNKSLY